MIDVAAILSLTEPARSHPDTMARLELRDDLHALLRRLEERHALPTPMDTSAPMRLRAGLLATLRAFEDLHGFEQRIPVRRARKEAA